MMPLGYMLMDPMSMVHSIGPSSRPLEKTILITDGGCLGFGVCLVSWLDRPKLGNPWPMVTNTARMQPKGGNQRAVFLFGIPLWVCLYGELTSARGSGWHR